MPDVRQWRPCGSPRVPPVVALADPGWKIRDNSPSARWTTSGDHGYDDTVTDMRAFCERQPDACAVGSQAAVALGHRAQAGAKMLYEYLNERLGPHDAGPAAAATTGKAVPLPQARPSRHTLIPADLAPAWAGPQPRQEVHADPAA